MEIIVLLIAIVAIKKTINMIATRSGRKENVLQCEISKNVFEMFLNYEKYHIFSKKWHILSVY